MSNAKQEAAAKIEHLRQKFVRALSATSGTFRAALRALRVGGLTPDALDELYRNAHNLAGTAGSFGYDELTRLARILEKAANAKENNVDNTAMMSALAAVIDYVENLESEASPGREPARTTPPETEPECKPETASTAAPGPALVTSRRSESCALKRPRAKVLVADADPFVGNILKSLMESEADIVSLLHGAEVASVAIDERPDLIILDDGLLDTSCDEIVFALQDDQSLRGIPVVVLAGNDNAQKGQSTENAAAEYIAKPLEPIQFVNHIRRRLENPEN